MLTVEVWGKSGCKLCAGMKDKLERMKIPYTYGDIEPLMGLHEGWRDGRAVELKAKHQIIQEHLPMVLIDGYPYAYAPALKELKIRSRQSA